MKIVITVKDTDNVIGLKEDIAMRLEGVTDIVRIDTADVVPKSEVAREIFEDFTKHKVCTNEEDFRVLAELKKKYMERNNG